MAGFPGWSQSDSGKWDPPLVIFSAVHAVKVSTQWVMISLCDVGGRQWTWDFEHINGWNYSKWSWYPHQSWFRSQNPWMTSWSFRHHCLEVPHEPGYIRSIKGPQHPNQFELLVCRTSKWFLPVIGGLQPWNMIIFTSYRWFIVSFLPAISTSYRCLPVIGELYGS